MTTTYVQKPERVRVQVITPELHQQLAGHSPGLVKRASVGDYLVSPEDGGPSRVLTPTQLEAWGVPEEKAKADAGHVGAFEKLLRELADRVATLEAKLEEHRAVVQPALENAVRALTKHAEGEAKHPEASRGKGGAK